MEGVDPKYSKHEVHGYPRNLTWILQNDLEKVTQASFLMKTNMSVENQWLEDVFPTEIVPF